MKSSIKVREARCNECYTKIIQTGRGRSAIQCARCRELRKEKWRSDQREKAAKEQKRLDTGDRDNA